MKQIQQIANRFREVILNGTWIANTNFRDQLDGLDWQIATTPVNKLNTIALLAQHVHYYIHGVKKVLEGGTLDISDKYSFDFPEITSPADWSAVLAKLWADAEAFAVLVENMADEQLDSVFVAEKYGTYYRNMEAMIEHCYYHLGQVVLIKKILLGT